ncbi:hypothetical protein F4679DRAFT_484028 [Xylaria curta]|nr:hypothetical protein F4679DRAFT_484028 [Xylaria curta]
MMLSVANAARRVISQETVLREAEVVLKDASTVAKKDTQLAIAQKKRRSFAVIATRKVTPLENALSPRICPRFNVATVTSTAMAAVNVPSPAIIAAFNAKTVVRWATLRFGARRRRWLPRPLTLATTILQPEVVLVGELENQLRMTGRRRPLLKWVLVIIMDGVILAEEILLGKLPINYPFVGCEWVCVRGQFVWAFCGLSYSLISRDNSADYKGPVVPPCRHDILNLLREMYATISLLD